MNHNEILEVLKDDGYLKIENTANLKKACKAISTLEYSEENKENYDYLKQYAETLKLEIGEDIQYNDLKNILIEKLKNQIKHNRFISYVYTLIGDEKVLNEVKEEMDQHIDHIDSENNLEKLQQTAKILNINLKKNENDDKSFDELKKEIKEKINIIIDNVKKESLQTEEIEKLYGTIESLGISLNNTEKVVKDIDNKLPLLKPIHIKKYAANMPQVEGLITDINTPSKRKPLAPDSAARIFGDFRDRGWNISVSSIIIFAALCAIAISIGMPAAISLAVAPYIAAIAGALHITPVAVPIATSIGLIATGMITEVSMSLFKAWSNFRHYGRIVPEDVVEEGNKSNIVSSLLFSAFYEFDKLETTEAQRTHITSSDYRANFVEKLNELQEKVHKNL